MKLAIAIERKRVAPATTRKATGAGFGLMLLVLFSAGMCWAQSKWNIEVVDNGSGHDVGKYSSLAIDQQGNLHVGYYDETRGALWYAFRPSNEKRWFKMMVQPTGVGAYSSLAVDAQGLPHFSYVDRLEHGLHYAFWDGKVWHNAIIDPTRAGYFNSISLDSKGHPRISYYQYHGPSGANVLHLKYAFFDGQQWFIQTVDPRMSTGKFNSITVDSQGNPHIAYAHVALGDLFYARWDGSQWHYTDTDSRRFHNDYVGEGNCIALDHAGHPGIAYFDISRNIVKYAGSDGKMWKIEPVSQLRGRGELDRVSLKFDSQNQPHIAFYDAGQGALKLAVRDGKGWQIETVDSNGNVGFTPSLWLDEHDNAYITYYDFSEHALKLASQVAAAARPAVAAKR